MATSGSFSGSDMGLVLQPATLSSIPSVSNTTTEGVSSRPLESRGRGTNKLSFVPGSFVFSPQERLKQEEGHPRPLNPQQDYLLPNLPDDHRPRLEEGPTVRGIYDFHRPQRRLLARPYTPIFQKVSRISDRKPEVSVSCAPVWLEHSSSGVYQTHEADSEGTSDPRGRDFSLSGRLVGVGSYQGGVSEEHKPYPGGSSAERVCGQLGKIPSSSEPSAGLARSNMGSRCFPSLLAHRQGFVVGPRPEKVSEAEFHFPKGFGTYARETAVRFFSRPGGEGSAKVSELDSQIFCQEGQERYKVSVPSESQGISQEMVPSRNFDVEAPLAVSSPISGSLHRRVTDGVGCLRLQGESDERTVVSRSKEISHKYSRDDSSFSGFEETALLPRFSYSSPLRQHDGGQLSEQTGFGKVSSSQQLGNIYPISVEGQTSLSYHLSCCRSSERGGGRPIEEQAAQVGVVSRQHLFPAVMREGFSSTSGFVRHQRESEGGGLCLPDSRSTGHRDRRVLPGLGQVGAGLSFSTNEPDPEGCVNPGSFSRASHAGNAGLAEPAMVHPAVGTCQVRVPHSQSSTVPAGRRDYFLGLIKNVPTPGLLDFLRCAYKEIISPAAADILVHAIRQSTAHQYQVVWSSFCDFVRRNNFPSISDSVVLSFLTFLFHERKLAVATITAYKSSLVRPMQTVFGLNLSSSLYTDFTKGIGNLRPQKPYSPIRWSLDKALSLALSSRFQSSPSLKDLTSMLAFLLSIALGSRASELHAILRGDDHIVFSGEGVTFYPNPNFLAKNENPQNRRNPIFVPLLRGADGAPHPLCPVEKLRFYLSVTSNTTSIKLFVHPSTLKDLTLPQLRYFICLFIREAHPGSFPKVHDLRKLASSYAFFRTMSLEDICEVTGWSSCRVFRRHYLSRLQEVATPFVALGSTVHSSKN